jgi:hypothetical protein
MLDKSERVCPTAEPVKYRLSAPDVEEGTMRTLVLAVTLLIASGPIAQEEAPAGETAGALSVTKGVMALRVENREPIGEGVSFEPGVGQLACYTQIEGAGGETVVYHVWMQGGELRAKVQLPVRSPRWRTWSTKRILPGWTGDWTVRVEDSDGNVLKTVAFTVGGSSS